MLHRERLLLGVVHLRALPGSPGHTGDSIAVIADAAQADAEAILAAGFDGYVIENFGDTPFFPGPVPPHVLTCMTRIAREMPRPAGAFIVVNVLRNDAAGALAVATAAELQAVRVNVHIGAMVTDQGVIEGRAAETLRLRQQVCPEVLILADVDVKHAAPLAPRYDLAGAARDTALRGRADALIVTGTATGEGASFQDLERVQQAVPDHPVLVGSGVTIESASGWYERCAGIIVGSALKVDGIIHQPIDPGRALDFAAACRSR